MVIHALFYNHRHTTIDLWYEQQQATPVGENKEQVTRWFIKLNKHHSSLPRMLQQTTNSTQVDVHLNSRTQDVDEHEMKKRSVGPSRLNLSGS